jgi:hypothetical protein
LHHQVAAIEVALAPVSIAARVSVFDDVDGTEPATPMSLSAAPDLASARKV